MAAAAVGVALLAGCGSSDSTVSKTPEAATTTAATAAQAPATVLPPRPPAPSAPAPDPCAVNLAAPEIAKTVSELPRDPRSGQAWSSEPLAGTYNECAQLSAIIVKANTNAENPNTRAVLFHLGKYIPTGVPDTYGFNGIEPTESTGDTVALVYSSGTSGLESVVKFRWNGAGVELIGNTPG
ncbi:LppP/LprE family lipoprotein [Mycobacterium sp. ITM-2016-00318]|uniref:LppP/LprE family lipoprotein n=1 Tax=Mycobacterium sp. ITM-2016-00318 TaxID=2099693 RepID=UPI000CF9B5AE|nr:LppP/LprE family lipoprotein [Mycobacterium sp. ITM-2016-00318]WNG95575.1 LppP/LprE family lipoprotein [Mycobacterium sp. ITM-2016-00318]